MENLFNNFKDSISTGVVTSSTVTSSVDSRSFRFTTMRESFDDVIISKKEWDKFIEFVGLKKESTLKNK